MIRIGVIGVGQMGSRHVQHFAAMKGVEVVVCDSRVELARRVAAKNSVREVYFDLDTMLDQANLTAVSNATPDAAHAATSLKALERGLHVLCEKPLATCYDDARRMAEAAEAKGVINMVHFSYRNAPAIHAARQMVQSGRLGQVRHFEASYLQSWLAQDAWGDWRASDEWLWRLSASHSKGVLGDVGVHILDFATYPCGEVAQVFCRLHSFEKCPGNRIGRFTLDANDSAAVTAQLTNGALGVIHASRWATGHLNSVRLTIHGTQAAVRVDLDRAQDELEVCEGADLKTGLWKRLTCGATPLLYERFVEGIRTGRNDACDFARGAYVQKLLDACELSDRNGAPVQI